MQQWIKLILIPPKECKKVSFFSLGSLFILLPHFFKEAKHLLKSNRASKPVGQEINEDEQYLETRPPWL